MWIVPYINYEPLYKDLLQISNIKNKLHKVGSIARECFEHKELTTLIIKRKKEDEKIEYTDDNMKRRYCEKHNITLVEIPYTEENLISYDYIMKRAGY